MKRVGLLAAAVLGLSMASASADWPTTLPKAKRQRPALPTQHTQTREMARRRKQMERALARAAASPSSLTEK